MTMPSMEEAAKISDVVKRHAYVFDNGLSSPDFFDVEKRMASEEFGLIRDRCSKDHRIYEIGCFTGLNLIGLAELGFKRLSGIDFVEGAIEWLRNEAKRRSLNISTFACEFDGRSTFSADRMVCFDVLEHQLNQGSFLNSVSEMLSKNGSMLLLVPLGRNYHDCGHVAWYPDAECLRNLLEYFFDVNEIFVLSTCQKIFASCRKKKK